MSKLAKQLTATATGDHKAKRMKYVDTSSTFSPNLHTAMGIHAKYSLGLKIQHDVWIDTESINPGEQIARAKKDMVAAITEEVFGEFRSHLIDLRMTLYNEDLTQARNVLSQLEYQMFSDE